MLVGCTNSNLWDIFWEYSPDLFGIIKNRKKGIFSFGLHFLDRIFDKLLNNEVNGDYEGSLYFQQYTSQVEAYKELDGMLSGLSWIPIPELSISGTILGFLHNFDKRDGQIVAGNITGFIKGAQLEIERIDALLSDSKDSNLNIFLELEKQSLKNELTLNKNYYENNYVYQDRNLNIIKVNRNQIIQNAKPLPGIDYYNYIYRKPGVKK